MKLTLDSGVLEITGTELSLTNGVDDDLRISLIPLPEITFTRGVEDRDGALVVDGRYIALPNAKATAVMTELLRPRDTPKAGK